MGGEGIKVTCVCFDSVLNPWASLTHVSGVLGLILDSSLLCKMCPIKTGGQTWYKHYSDYKA